MQAKIATTLLSPDNNQEKISKFIEFSLSDGEKNQLQVKNAVKDLDVNESESGRLEEFMANPRYYRSVGVFSSEGKLTHIEPLSFPHSGEYKGKNYYVLPLFDFRNAIHERLYLLQFSRKEIKLYRAHHLALTPVELEGIQTYDEEMSRLWKEKSMQHHGAENAVYHGQGAADYKEREGEHFNIHISHLAKKLNDFGSRLDNLKIA